MNNIKNDKELMDLLEKDRLDETKPDQGFHETIENHVRGMKEFSRLIEEDHENRKKQREMDEDPPRNSPEFLRKT